MQSGNSIREYLSNSSYGVKRFRKVDGVNDGVNDIRIVFQHSSDFVNQLDESCSGETRVQDAEA